MFWPRACVRVTCLRVYEIVGNRNQNDASSTWFSYSFRQNRRFQWIKIVKWWILNSEEDYFDELLSNGKDYGSTSSLLNITDRKVCEEGVKILFCSRATRSSLKLSCEILCKRILLMLPCLWFFIDFSFLLNSKSTQSTLKVEQRNASVKESKEKLFNRLSYGLNAIFVIVSSSEFHFFKRLFMSDVTMAEAGIFPLFQPAAKPLSTPFKCQVILRVESSTDNGRIIYSFAILSVEQKT